MEIKLVAKLLVLKSKLRGGANRRVAYVSRSSQEAVQQL
jgi:hypothetical protein